MAKLTDVEARAILDRVVPPIAGDLSALSVDLIQAVARFETGYGGKWGPTGCGPAAESSNNWGAVHAGGKWATEAEATCTPGKSFVCKDGDGKGGVYWTCFRAYPTPDAGAADVVKILWGKPTTRGYLQSGDGDPFGMADAMKRAGYFEASTDLYGKALRANVAEIRKSLGREERPKWPAYAGAGIAFVGLMAGAWRFRHD